MKKIYSSILLSSIILGLVAGCGNASPKAASEQGTFGAAKPVEVASEPAADSGIGGKTNASGQERQIENSSVKPANMTSGKSSQEQSAEKGQKPAINEKQPPKADQSVPVKEVKPGLSDPSKEKADAKAKSTDKQPKITPDADAVKTEKTAKQAASKKSETSKSQKPKTSRPASSSPEPIAWSEFFDDDKQDTPSNKFWDLNDQTVTINGYMGEVLSFEKHWFLIIPKPGAECPFDNGDETYWNKIMIAFVPDDVKLRYNSSALKITGQLNVGIKIDESGYKTMFRLYNAKFEEINE